MHKHISLGFAAGLLIGVVTLLFAFTEQIGWQLWVVYSVHLLYAIFLFAIYSFAHSRGKA